MPRATRHVAVGIVLVALATAGGAAQTRDRQDATDQDSLVDSSILRVRTDNDILASLIKDATTHSVTFRRMTQAIQGTNGVVYVEHGRCKRSSVRACLPYWMEVAGPHRVLRVVVERLDPPCETIGAIAHELQHALEILGEPNITTGRGMFFFYKSHGSLRGDAFETNKAIDMGNAVRREMSRRPRRRE